MSGFYRSYLRVCLILAWCIAFAIQMTAVTPRHRGRAEKRKEMKAFA